MAKVWLITGSGNGLGRDIAEAALAAGNNVVAGARRTEELAPLVAQYDERVKRKRVSINAQAKNPGFDLKRELFRIAGVDLTDVPGISTITARTILMEAGADVSRFRNASAFASWLGLCLDKRVSGGKVLCTKTRKVKNRAAIALRLGAHYLYHAKNYLGQVLSQDEVAAGRT